jgi:DNA-binding NarL/FixJ family response regulator
MQPHQGAYAVVLSKISGKTGVGMIQKANILVADDSAEVANRLAGMLSELEQVNIVGPARDGHEALELYHKHRPLGAVLDLQMPGLNGLELLGAIREHNPFCLVIILTNENSKELRRSCLEAGADHYLHKSADFEQVAGIIQNFIRAQGGKLP